MVPDQGPLPGDGDTTEGVSALNFTRGLDEVVEDLGHQGDVGLDGCLPEALVLERVHPPLGLGGADLVKEIQLTINAEISQNIRSSQDLS